MLLWFMRKISSYISIVIFCCAASSFFAAALVHAADIWPDDEYYDRQWYLERIKADRAWTSSRSSLEVVVAVIDSGIAVNHEDLRENIWLNEDEVPGNGRDDDRNGYIDDVNGWDFVNDSSDPSPKFVAGYMPDEMVHGSVVAGIIGAKGNNGVGVSGVAWDVKLMPLAVLDAKGSGDIASVVQAIDYAIKNGADIINFSFSGSVYNSNLEAAIRRAKQAGVLVVAAAGNNNEGDKGRNLDFLPMYPVCNDGYYGENLVLGVAATDALDQKASFSSYGKACVDLSAPGISIYSTSFYSPRRLDGKEVLNRHYDGYWSGTSMASPQVAGAAALVLATNPSLSRKELFDIMLASADYIERLNPSYAGELGAGRLNVYQAVAMARERLALRGGRVINFATQAVDASTSPAYISDIDGNDRIDLTFKGPFRGPLNIAAGNLDERPGDEIVLAAGSGGGPQIQVQDQDGRLLSSFFAYKSSFRGGVRVAVGDVDGDGKNEIITVPQASGGPHVRVFNLRGQVLSQFFAFPSGFRGGLSVGVGDINGDGREDIVCGAGPGGGPQVRVFDGKGKLLTQFFAFEKEYRGGINIAVGDIDGGLQKRAEIAVAGASKRDSAVRVFDNYAKLVAEFKAFGSRYTGRTDLSFGDADQDGQDELIVSSGSQSSHVRIFETDSGLVSAYYAYGDNHDRGVSTSFTYSY